jgi:large subunit ribosomal protein L21
MYAIIAHSGKQYRVSEGDELELDRISDEVGSNVEVAEVLLIGGDETKVGTPHVDGAKVTLEVLGHGLGDKRETYKYTARQRTRVSRGFRASTTKVRVQSISA